MKIFQTLVFLVSFDILGGSKSISPVMQISHSNYLPTYGFIINFFRSCDMPSFINEITQDHNEKIIVLTFLSKSKKLMFADDDMLRDHNLQILKIVETCYQLKPKYIRIDDVGAAFLVHFCHILYSDTLEFDEYTNTPIITSEMLYKPFVEGAEARYAVPISSNHIKHCIKLRIKNFLTYASKLYNKLNGSYWHISKVIATLDDVYKDLDCLLNIETNAETVTKMLTSRLYTRRHIFPLAQSVVLNNRKNYPSSSGSLAANTFTDDQNHVLVDLDISRISCPANKEDSLFDEPVYVNMDKLNKHDLNIHRKVYGNTCCITHTRDQNTVEGTSVKCKIANEVPMPDLIQETHTENIRYLSSYISTNILSNYEFRCYELHKQKLPTIKNEIDFQISNKVGYICFLDVLEYLRALYHQNIIIRIEISRHIVKVYYEIITDGFEWIKNTQISVDNEPLSLTLAKEVYDDNLMFCRALEDKEEFLNLVSKVKDDYGIARHIVFKSESNSTQKYPLTEFLCLCKNKQDTIRDISTPILSNRDLDLEKKIVLIIERFLKNIESDDFLNNPGSKFDKYRQYLVGFHTDDVNSHLIEKLICEWYPFNLFNDDLSLVRMNYIVQDLKSKNIAKISKLCILFKCEQDFDVMIKHLRRKYSYHEHQSFYFTMSYYFACDSLANYTNQDLLGLSLYQIRSQLGTMMNDLKFMRVETFKRMLNLIKQRMRFNLLVFESLRLQYKNYLLEAICELTDKDFNN